MFLEPLILTSHLVFAFTLDVIRALSFPCRKRWSKVLVCSQQQSQNNISTWGCGVAVGDGGGAWHPFASVDPCWWARGLMYSFSFIKPSVSLASNTKWMISRNTLGQQFSPLYKSMVSFNWHMLSRFALQRRQRNHTNCATVYHQQLKPVAYINYRTSPALPLLGSDDLFFFFF